MKALRIILALFVVTCLFYLPTSAQNNKIIRGTSSLDFEHFPADCAGESVSGTVYMAYTVKYFVDNKNRVGIITQHYTNIGTLIGDITGTEYSIKERNSYHDMANIEMNKATVNGSATAWMLQDGKKIARIKYSFHLTFVHGEPKVFFEIEDVKCF